MSALEDARDHARRMADWPGDPRDASERVGGWCTDFPGGTDRHADCDGSVSLVSGDLVLCSCLCHPRDPGPSPADRALWTQLADEIDAHLAAATSDDDQLTIGD